MNKQAIENHFAGRFQEFFQKYLPAGVKKIGGDEWQALCPFHADSKPSLSINAQTGLYFCHGCNKKGSFLHFYAKLNGLNDRRDFPKILAGIARDFGIEAEEVKARLVKTYDYTDEAGSLLFQVCRYEPKSFKQRMPAGSGKWDYRLNGVRRVLYRLPEVLKAEEVLMVEGEKDADTVAGLGFTGTTSPMGAKKWRPEYGDSLKGKDVVLIPDNDQEGREHMAQVGAALRGIARSMRWLDLPGLPSKGDVSDWVATFSTKEEAAERLAMMIEAAGPYDAPKVYTIEDAVLNVADYHRIDLPRKQTILRPIVCEQQIILASGWRGVGKSWFALGLLDAVTRGINFGPWEIETSVPCLYMDGEMAAEDTKKRIRDLNPSDDRKSPLYVYSDAYANHLGLARANLLSESWRTTMKRILLTRGVKLWVVDNIASLASGIDENVKKDWDPINSWLLDLRFAGITTLLLHHTNKEGAQRGTSAREDNIDTSLILKQPADYEADRGADFILTFSKSRVSFEELAYLGDVHFTLTTNEDGSLAWTWERVRAERKAEIIALLDQGESISETARIVGCSKSYVSKVNQDRKNGEN